MVDREGVPLGRIAHIYLDRVTGEPEWALVATGQEGRRVFVPLVDAAEQENRVRVPIERAVVTDAPAIRPGRQLSKEATARLHGHYGGAPQLRWARARRAPGGGPPARLRQGLGWARERATSLPRVGFPGRRRLLAAGVAASSVAGGLLLIRRRRRERPSGLAAAVGSVLAVPAGRLRRRRLRALAGTATAPLAAAGRAAARAGRRVPVPSRTLPPRRPRNRRTRMAGNLKLLAGLAAGYVLGARAGRERYERIAQATRRLAERPEAGGPAAGTRPEQETGQIPLAEARPAADEDHGRTRSPQSEAGEADERGRDAGESSPEPGPSRGRREHNRSR
jgi:hypothetical protein